ncbi:MAG: TSCPD domain-containing protein [Bacteroidales bacterium]|nr:TSCPD domain-containing protein [Bacteroidales bacterium]
MKHTLYKTQGTCSQYIDVTVDDEGVVRQVFFMGGCDGNLQAVCRLVRGRKIDDVISKQNDTGAATLLHHFLKKAMQEQDNHK